MAYTKIFYNETLTRFLIEEQRRFNHATGGFTGLVNDVRLACKRIARVIGKGALSDALGTAGTTNVQGEAQMKLDVLANDIFVAPTSGAASSWHALGGDGRSVPHSRRISARQVLLLFDPLDGSSNIDVNVSVGSIFSVLRCPEGVSEPTEKDFLQPGTQQVCAGYAIYGPSTMLVLTTGRGVNGFYARPRDRRVHADPPGHYDRHGHVRVRHQRVQLPLLGTGNQALRQ